MASTTWRSFSAAASFTPSFSTSGPYAESSSASLLSFPPLRLFCSSSLHLSPLSYAALPSPLDHSHSSATVCKSNLKVLNFSADTETLPSYVLFKEVGGMCTGGMQRPPVVCGYVACTICVSTLELVDFRALCVHVGVIQRVAGRVAVGRRRVLWCVSV